MCVSVRVLLRGERLLLLSVGGVEELNGLHHRVQVVDERVDADAQDACLFGKPGDAQ